MFLLTAPVLTIISILGLAFFYALVISAQKIEIIRKICLSASFAALFVGVLVGLSFDKASAGFQYLSSFNYVMEYNSSLALGVDGLSYVFLLLTLVIFPFLFLAAWTVSKFPKHFFCHLLAMELLLVLTFVTVDLFYFFILFESLLIPMFILIGVWGARTRKIKAAYYFFLYTLFGSLFMLFGMIYLYQITGSLNYHVLLAEKLDISTQKLLWLCFFLAFAVKMPLFPFHIWLPEAHVEAPTVGSMLLASLLLKLGGYGLLRFSLTFLGDASVFFIPLVSTLAIAGVIYGSLSTMRQIDLKRIIAYSSVAHMNLVALGIFSFNRLGVEGSIYLMVAHGVVSAALFFCVGVVYDRTHTRLLRYYGGLVTVMPVFVTFFFIFNLANMGFPGTPNFVGELLMLAGIFACSPAVLYFAAWGIVFSAAYSTNLFAKVGFGTLKTGYINQFIDVNRLEAFILFAFTGLSLFLGLCSNIVLTYVEAVAWNISDFNTLDAVAHISTSVVTLLATVEGGTGFFIFTYLSGRWKARSKGTKVLVRLLFLQLFFFWWTLTWLFFPVWKVAFLYPTLMWDVFYRPPFSGLLLFVLLFPLSCLLLIIFRYINSWRRLLTSILLIYTLLIGALADAFPTLWNDGLFLVSFGECAGFGSYSNCWVFVIEWIRCLLLLITFTSSALELAILWNSLRTDVFAMRLIIYFTLRTCFVTLAIISTDFVVLFVASQGISIFSYLTFRFWAPHKGQTERFALGTLLINQISDIFLLGAAHVLSVICRGCEFDTITNVLPLVPPVVIQIIGPAIPALPLSSTLLFLWLVGKVCVFGTYAKTPTVAGRVTPVATFSCAAILFVFVILLVLNFHYLLWLVPPSFKWCLYGAIFFRAIFLLSVR